MRGKIWMMVILLAVANCLCGAVVFVAASYLVSANWVPVVLAITVSTVTTIAFAWWISNDVLRPLDRLNLLAKSIERSPGMSVPRTTGSVETDDLLHTISRASRQLTNFVDLMDEVTAGNTKAALDPLEHSDRLSESFQKLVAKVTDSIDAKAELGKLQQAVNQISSELSGLQRGEPVRVRNEFEGTKVITDALRFLVERHGSITQVVGSNTAELRTIVGAGKNRSATLADKHSARDRVLTNLAAGLSEANAEVDRTFHGLSSSLLPVDEVLADLSKELINPEESSKMQAAMRKQFDAAIHKLRNVGEQALAITHVAKAVQDLAKRSNMIALNTSIQANEESAAGLSTITQEIASLSERAEKANKAIAGISDSVVRDVNEANASLQWVTAEVGKLGTRFAGTEETIESIRERLTPLQGISARLDEVAARLTARAHGNAQVLEDCFARSEEVAGDLRMMESSFAMLHESLDTIRESIGANRQVLTPLAVEGAALTNGNGSKNNNGVPADAAVLVGEK